MNPWDSLAKRFNTKKNILDIHHDAAVNIFVGWPIFLQNIKLQKEYQGKNSLDILDFGCGDGRLCEELHNNSNNVTGIDKSHKMIELAKTHVPSNVNIKHYAEFLQEGSDTKFDVITSMHVLDWIEDIESTLNLIIKRLKPGGLFLFSVFPQKHVIDSIKIKDLFEDFDDKANPTVGFANFDGIRVKVFVRKAEYYDAYFQNNGLNKVIEMYPPYPKYFLQNYNWTGSLEPEMLILGYRQPLLS